MGNFGVLVHNSCHNPYGRLGGNTHRTKITEISDDLQSRGYKVINEKYIKTPGGFKNKRFADIYATNGSDTIVIQVGRMNKGGTPVIRERRALTDIISAGENAIFIPY